jgi:hypothetical protein
MSREFRRDFLRAGVHLARFGVVSAIFSDGVDGIFSPDIFPSLEEFIERVSDGEAQKVVGIYIKEKLAFPVIQQPPGYKDFVSQWTVATQFRLGAFGLKDDTGLLLDAKFVPNSLYDVSNGDLEALVYGDGRVETYKVTNIHRFLALSPEDPHSQFRELDGQDISGKLYSADMVFRQMYTDSNSLNDKLTIQVCELNRRRVPIIRRFIVANINK